ncbi:RNA polymerase Rpb6 [Cyclonatronum proteinivorum]|uniref:RNA polymerase Rpb6 n=1 Tax=Cyclonatronum proteinivorum TaxID=1457365 RepID=A0A345UNY4_9BACT|nr:DNA-directed RNA polymerase subunit omega [Cyclonatronum proteinivorum]AXJ02186.1 RNA polymerase Rpb6 [Cyclonatronum proteinivorum]
MSARALDVEKIQDTTGNLYESIVIMAKRSRQIAAREKMELDEKLRYFEGFEEEDEFSFNEEQERISKEYEAKSHPVVRGVGEFLDNKVAYRYPDNQ